MTTDLRSRLDDLASSRTPESSSAVSVARTAWASGRRRHHRRQAGIATLTLVFLLIAGIASFPALRPGDPLEPTDGTGSSGVTGFPERIGHQLWVPDLPTAPGPMALLLSTVSHRSFDRPENWQAVSENGVRWTIPDVYGTDFMPSLSPNGRYLAYLTGMRGPYVIRDLVTGRVTRFAAVGSNIGSSPSPYTFPEQTPVYWSPDGRYLVTQGWARGRNPGRASSALVVGVDGRVSVALLPAPGIPAGFVAPHTLVWLSLPQLAGRGPIRAAATFTNLAGDVERTVPLGARLPSSELGQWSATVSPDGSELLVREEQSFTAAFERFSLTTGAVVGSRVSANYDSPICPHAWRRSTPVAMELEGESQYPALLTPSGPSRLIAIEPRLDPTCVIWAADALQGTRHSMLFGMSMNWFSWWWRELLIGLVLLASAVWFPLRWRAVRRHRRI